MYQSTLRSVLAQKILVCQTLGQHLFHNGCRLIKFAPLQRLFINIIIDLFRSQRTEEAVTGVLVIAATKSMAKSAPFCACNASCVILRCAERIAIGVRDAFLPNRKSKVCLRIELNIER